MTTSRRRPLASLAAVEAAALIERVVVGHEETRPNAILDDVRTVVD